MNRKPKTKTTCGMKDLTDMTHKEIQKWVEERSTFISEYEEKEYRERVSYLEAIADHFRESNDVKLRVYGHALYSLSLDFWMFMDDFRCRMPLSCFKEAD